MALSSLIEPNVSDPPAAKAAAAADVGKCPRVLYLTDLLPAGKFGSMEEQIFVLAKAFRERGGVLLPVFGGPLGPKVVKQYSAAGLTVEGLNLHYLSVSSLFRLLRLIRDNQITIVHWNFYSPINPYVWLLTILAPSLTHYLTDHTSRVLPLGIAPNGPKRFLKKLLFKRYRKVLCISDFVVECLEHQGTWSNVERCTYFVNTERFKPNPDVRIQMRSQLGIEQEFVVLFVAHLIRLKGGDVAIKALSELPDSVQLWVVGDGEDRTRLEALCEKLSLSSRVRFLGNQWNVELYMQAADCFVCPSLWGEATGLVNLEALACGLPVVASAIGGIPEFVRDEAYGLLFTPGDPHQLADRIRRLLVDPDLCKQLSRAARLAAVERYSIERRLPEYVELYRS